MMESDWELFAKEMKLIFTKEVSVKPEKMDPSLIMRKLLVTVARVMMMMHYTSLFSCIGCLLFWDKLSSTIVEWQLFWSRQVGAGELLFWGKEKNISRFSQLLFKLSEIFITHTICFLGLLLQCSLPLLFKWSLDQIIWFCTPQRHILFLAFIELWDFGPYKFLRRRQPGKNTNLQF